MYAQWFTFLVNIRCSEVDNQESQVGCLHSIRSPFIGEPPAPAGVTRGGFRTAPGTCWHSLHCHGSITYKRPHRKRFWRKVCCYRCCLICILIIFNYVGDECPHVSAPRKGNSSPELSDRWLWASQQEDLKTAGSSPVQEQDLCKIFSTSQNPSTGDAGCHQSDLTLKVNIVMLFQKTYF